MTLQTAISIKSGAQATARRRIVLPGPVAPVAFSAGIAGPALEARLETYITGWATGDAEQIASAVTPDYAFRDPFVGTFDRRNLADYFDVLESSLAFGSKRNRPFPVVLRGAPEEPATSSRYRLWRDVVEFGLTGMTDIRLGGNGIVHEVVSYDLNMAAERLRDEARLHLGAR